MKTLYQIPVSKNGFLAIVETSVLYEYNAEMLKNLSGKYAVIKFFNFNDGLKDNIEGITIVGILSNLDMAEIVFNHEVNRKAGKLIIATTQSPARRAAIMNAISNLSDKGIILVGGDIKSVDIGLAQQPTAFLDRIVDKRLTEVPKLKVSRVIDFENNKGSKYHK